MTALGLCLLWSAFQATLIAIVAMVMGARPWRVGGAFTPLVALLAIATLTLCSLLPVPGWWPNDIRPAERTARDVVALSSRAAINQESVPPVTDRPAEATHPGEQIRFVDLAVGFIDELKSVRTQADQRWLQSSVPKWVVGVFGLGIAIGLLRLVLGMRGAGEIRRASHVINDKTAAELMDVLQAQLGLRQRVELRQADQLTTAATMGYRSPVILLPAHWKDWQEQELQAVLSHELAHIHHRDFAAQLLAQLGLILHFYNPMVHWLSERMKLEQELAADAIAARLAGGQRDYLRVLATLAIDHQNNHVGWPARAFLPTRNSFLRRLEMLRASRALSAGSSVVGRLGVLTFITAITVALITLRPEAGLPTAKASGVPADARPSQGVEEILEGVTQDTANAAVTATAYDLRYLGEDVELVAGARPAELLKSSQLKSVYEAVGKQFTKELKQSGGFDIDEIEQVVFGMGLQPEVAGSMSVYVRLTKARRIGAEMVKGKAIDIDGQAAIEFAQGLVLWQPDDRSIVINTRARIEKLIAKRFAHKSFAESKAWAQVSQEDAFVLASGKLLRTQWESAGAALNAPPLKTMVSSISPIVEEAAYVGLSAAIKSEMRMAMVVECQDEKGIKRVQESTSTGVVQLKNALRDLAKSVETQAKIDDGREVNASRVNSASGQFTKFAMTALDKVESQVNGKLLTLTTRLTESEFPGELLANVTGAARRAAQRQTSTLNMKQLGIAIHGYHDAHRALPQSAITVPTNVSKVEPRKYPYSWRVAILPWLDNNALYNKYKFDEPWDSPSNLEVLEQMPAVYRHPDAPADTTNTSYVILVGESTMFPPGRLSKFADIDDGTANTIMVVEAKTSIPWTKPEDLEYAADKPLPKFGGYSSEGYNVLLADASVRFFSKTLDETLLRKLITARGGEQLK